MKVEQDFTADKSRLKKVLDDIDPAGGQGFAAGATGDDQNGAENMQAYTADESDYNVFNTDRKIEALGSLADSLSRIQQKKSIVYFSNGVSKNGQDNEAELRSAINRAIKANVAIYPVDIRGLEALPPGGDARQASVRGVGMFSGAQMRGQFNANFASQETLVTLASDTGGKAFTDSNDFNQVFTRVQRDTSTYYVLGYRSSNAARDGRYRRIIVKLKDAKLNGGGSYKLEFRSGYYAPRDFAHSTHDDRELQLETELGSDLSATDLRVYLAAAYFRQDDAHFYVPVSIVVPGSEIPFTKEADKDKASLDIVGVVRNELKMPVGNARETVKLNLDETQEVRRKNVQYRTGFTLPPGNYHLKFVVRENQTGRIGSYETDISIPDLRKTPLRLSSVLIGNQLAPARSKSDLLARDGQELLPSLSHVFVQNQKLYFYYEVYDPARVKAAAAPAATERPGGGAAERPADKPKDAKNAIHLLTSISFFNGKVKTYETPLVEARELNLPQRKAAVFQFEVPLEKLKPGLYTCQVNIIDDAAGAFAFPRLALLVRQ
jgi:VWFA-related protein